MEQTSPPALTLSLDPATGEIRAVFDPATGGPPPEIDIIEQALAERGWSGFEIDEPALSAFVARCHPASGIVVGVLGRSRDGEFSLTVDPDMMTARLTLTPPRGGKAVDRADIAEALQQRGVVYGIRPDAIAAALADGSCLGQVIARGEPVVEGRPTRFENLFDQRHDSANEDELGRKHYADFSYLLLVDVGNPLMRRHPPVPGQAGTNLTGSAVAPKPLADIPFRPGLQGAAPDGNDPDLLRATSGGQPVLLPDGVMVNPLIEVKDVDYGTGSIEFDGALRVTGDVKAGLRIKVSGDVIVNGAVESAHITAGGNIAVRGGVIGHQETHAALPESTATLICAGHVQALFMENARVEAGQSILVERGVHQCELTARDEIIIGKRGSKNGQIIGGKTQATTLISAGSLGNVTGVKTELLVGVDPYLENQIATEEQQLKKKMEEVDNVLKLLAYFKQNPQKGAGGMLEKVEATRQQLLATTGALNAELQTLRDQREQSGQGKIEVGGAIHYGVEVRIGRYSWQAADDISGGTIQLVDDLIRVSR
ncbi:MAG: FapA family protein [Azonexus sp.]|jgi:uncharacterized protein (DUF342 family)|nr:FapA family protein [Azonexus sp.]